MATQVPQSLAAASRHPFAHGRPHPGTPAKREPSPLRFLLAGDFRLGEVCRPLAGLDPRVQSKLISAPYAAAGQVIDLALFEQVDFVIVIGSMFSADQHGVQEPAFLMRQFTRLAEQSIPVIWATGRHANAAGWPDWIAWPDNVVELDSGAKQSFLFQRDDGRTASIACTLERTGPNAESALRVGVAPPTIHVGDAPGDLAKFDVIASMTGPIAGGIDHCVPPEFARGIGPQGRGFHEYGPHGCWLVSVDSLRRVQVDFVACDAIRWRCEIAELADETTWEELLRRCELQSRRAQASSHAVTFVKWQLIGHGPLCRELWEPARLDEFLAALRQTLQMEAGYECRVWVAEMELVFDPCEEARLRSEQSSWAAWSAAIEGEESVVSRHADSTAEPAIPSPHFQKLRRSALRKLMQNAGDK